MASATQRTGSQREEGGNHLRGARALPIRVGFVGCGEHARTSLYPSLRAAFGGSPSGLPDLSGAAQLPSEPLRARLVCVADHNRELAERVAAFHAVDAVYTDHRRMLEHEELDGVMISMHPRRQAEVAIDCLERGVHVWVEKPPADSLRDAIAMAAAASRAERALAVGYMKRFSAPYLRAQAIVAMPDFGAPSVYESRFTYGPYTDPSVYRFLNGFGTHHLDLARFFMGEVASVRAEHVSHGPGLDAYVLALRFESGAVGVMNLNSLEARHDNWSERVAVSGVGSRVVVENWRRVIATMTQDLPSDEPKVSYWEPDDIQPAEEQNSLAIHGFVAEIQDFIDSIASGRQPACTIDDGVAALRFERAIEHSIVTGSAVSPMEVDYGRP